jgi:hypothetical protein
MSAKRVSRPKRSARGGQSPSNTPSSLRALLAGGDRRSIAQSNVVLRRLRADPKQIAGLASLARDSDWLVVMRVMDLLEKLAHVDPEYVRPFRRLFIGPLARHESWEIRLQIARALPLLRWTSGEQKSEGQQPRLRRDRASLRAAVTRRTLCGTQYQSPNARCTCSIASLERSCGSTSESKGTHKKCLSSGL